MSDRRLRRDDDLLPRSVAEDLASLMFIRRVAPDVYATLHATLDALHVALDVPEEER